ncbi:MAG: hypothetical protein HY747_08400 [Elusimicrobia bacterium]|nr:hypothetical protein [Elusimicrobiota bacterium]
MTRGRGDTGTWRHGGGGIVDLRVSASPRLRVTRWLGRATLRTFIVDPPTMLVFGIGAVLIAAKFLKGNQKFVFWACAVFQLVFWIFGPMMYFDHPHFAAKGLGNDFMWNGYLMGLRVVPAEMIPTYTSPVMNVLAVIGWLVQPIFLYLGVCLGWRIFKTKNQKPEI